MIIFFRCSHQIITEALQLMVDIQVSTTQMEKKKSFYLAGRSIFLMSEVGKSSISNSQAS